MTVDVEEETGKGLGQIALEAWASTFQSFFVVTGIDGDWVVGISMIIRLVGRSPIRVRDKDVLRDGKGRTSREQRAWRSLMTCLES